MTNTISHAEAVGNADSTVEKSFDLPDDVPTLLAMKEAIDVKVGTLQSAGAEALRKKMAEESAQLGMSLEQLVNGTLSKKKRRGRAKRDE